MAETNSRGWIVTNGDYTSCDLKFQFKVIRITSSLETKICHDVKALTGLHGGDAAERQIRGERWRPQLVFHLNMQKLPDCVWRFSPALNGLQFTASVHTNCVAKMKVNLLRPSRTFVEDHPRPQIVCSHPRWSMKKMVPKKKLKNKHFIFFPRTPNLGWKKKYVSVQFIN